MRYLGKYQARWYRTVRGEMIDGEMKWKETAVTHMNLKSFVARVTKNGSQLQGARRRAERRHADQVGRSQGGRRPVADGDARSGDQGQVRLEAVHLHLERRDARRTHARLARRPTSTGKVQPTEKDLENKKSFLEENSQAPRKLSVA